MDIKKTPRTDARHASIVRQGLEWALTYGQRSAAAFLLVRKVPRPVVERIPISMDGRGRALVVVRQSRRRWEDAYSGGTISSDATAGRAASISALSAASCTTISSSVSLHPTATRLKSKSGLQFAQNTRATFAKTVLTVAPAFQISSFTSTVVVRDPGRTSHPQRVQWVYG
ncbi:hypothetical protein ACQ4WP_27850 [Janthinobacterium sp. GB4P2]|uniref:hypothetical protein n=1 Tax=Janthinobacterium sp. GB4P2 TaxID=3424189 RepID=UPI003F259268